ncbi:hypothetical protein D9M68_772100 [compost metagenome]
MPADVIRAGTDDRPCGQHVVQRSEAIAAAALQKDREILRMAVGGGEQPEEHLRLHEVDLVGGRLCTAVEHAQDLTHAGAAVRFVFERARHAEGLAEVFLRQPCNPFVRRACALHGAIEALHDEDLARTKHLDAAMCDGQAEGFGDARAEPFVLDRRMHVGAHVPHQSQRQLDDVGGRRGAHGPVPAVALLQ